MNEHVESKREVALFWHSIWLSDGSANNGVVADIRRTRLNYHYAVHYVRNNQDTISNQHMTDAILNNKSGNFWTEVKKVNGHN